MPYDYALFKRHIESETHILALMLKGHLWLEACLNRSLEVALEDPSKFNLERESFSRKMALAGALGTVAPDLLPVFAAVNGVRNKVAHQLDRDVTPADVDQIESAFGARQRAMYDRWFPTRQRNSRDPVNRLRAVVLFLVMAVEYATMIDEYEKTNAEALTTWRLLKALDEREPGDPALIEPYRPPNPPDIRAVWTDYAPDGTPLPSGSADS